MNRPLCLITGATGATRSAAIAALLEMGHSVRAYAHRCDDRSERLAQQGVEMMYGEPMTIERFVAKHRAAFSASVAAYI